MDYSRRFSALVLVFLLSGVVGGAEPAADGKGLLLLRNGNLLEGQIVQAGDYFVVVLGTSEIRLPAKDVEAQVASRDEAYQLRKFGMFGQGATPHLNLAEWCLRQELFARCQEQLTEARRIDPENSKIVEVERRLEFARAPRPTAVAPGVKPISSVTVRADDLEKVVRSLPKASVERFAAVVQPVLLNRCGANQCHGTNSKADFHLLRPAAGQAATLRFTQRNLYATLQYIDSASPDESPLLVLPQKPHGSSLTAVFDKHTQKQLDELKAWVRLTVATPEPTPPPTIPANEPATLSQPAATPGHAPVEPAAESAPAKVQAMRPAVGEPGGTAARSPTQGTFVPRDPFDPEIFNRRFAPASQAATVSRPK
jgi:hypothetical protein